MPTQWKVLFEATSIAELQGAIPSLSHLVEGGRGRFVVEGPGLGLLADAIGMEQLWGFYLREAGVSIVDVHGEGLNTAVVDWVAAPHPPAIAVQGVAQVASPVLIASPILIVAAVIAVLLALGWAFSKFTAFIEVLVGNGDKPGLLPLVLIGGAVVALVLFSRGKKGG